MNGIKLFCGGRAGYAGAANRSNHIGNAVAHRRPVPRSIARRSCTPDPAAKTERRNGREEVIDTDDLSTSWDPKPTPDSKPASPKKDAPKPLPYKTAGTAGFTPEMWTRTIQAQKDWIAHLRAEAEKLKTLRQVDINKLATDPEERKLREERSIAQQLASEIPEQQRKLEEAQDEARKAGMPASVYDPQ